MKAHLLIVFSIIFFHTYGLTQNQYDFEYSIPSKAFEKERKFYVHVPEQYYEKESEETFGVIYVLDAQGRAFYNNAKSIIDYLVWSYQIMPVIVVGVHSDNRGTEFIPKDRSLPADDPENSGTSHLLKEHIEHEIFPLVAEKFRITNFRALIGHSRGGAFVANTIFSDKKDMFNAYLAISPGMHYLNKQILNDAGEMIKEGTAFNKFYCCTHGTVGSLEKYFKPQVELIDSLLKAHPNNTLVWAKKEFEGTSHWGCVAPSLVYGLLEMSRSYQVDQYLIDMYADNKEESISDQIESYYKKQNQILKYTIPIDAGSLRYYGNQQSEYEQYDKAIELFDLSIALDSDNIRSYFSKAWAHSVLGEKPEAISTYKKALQVLEVNKLNLKDEEIERWKKNIHDELEKL